MERKSFIQLDGMVRPMMTATTKVAAPSSTKLIGTLKPHLLQRRQKVSEPTTMKAALSTLTAATTRARRSAPAQACTAAKVGTTNNPPAIASPARSNAIMPPAAIEESRRSLAGFRRVSESMRGPAEIDSEQPSSTAPISAAR